MDARRYRAGVWFNESLALFRGQLGVLGLLPAREVAR